MKAGPKGTVKSVPLDFTRLAIDRAQASRAVHRRVTWSHRAVTAQVEPFKLRPFQREIIRGSFAPGIRSAVVSIPRANGKTMMAAALGLAETVRRCRVGRGVGRRIGSTSGQHHPEVRPPHGGVESASRRAGPGVRRPAVLAGERCDAVAAAG